MAEGTTLAPWGNLGRRASRHDHNDDGHDDHDDEGPAGMMVMTMRRKMIEKGHFRTKKAFQSASLAFLLLWMRE